MLFEFLFISSRLHVHNQKLVVKINNKIASLYLSINVSKRCLNILQGFIYKLIFFTISYYRFK